MISGSFFPPSLEECENMIWPFITNGDKKANPHNPKKGSNPVDVINSDQEKEAGEIPAGHAFS